MAPTEDPRDQEELLNYPRAGGGSQGWRLGRRTTASHPSEEKIDLLDCLFAVSAAHRAISVIENNEISRIAAELKLEHADVVAARVRCREYLGVLRQP
jgi:hypothetical protein